MAAADPPFRAPVTLSLTQRIAPIRKALHDAEAFYNSLVENLPQNAYRKDREGRFTFVNQRFCAAVGRSREEVLGRTDFDLFPPELAAKNQQEDLRVIETRQPFEAVETRTSLEGGRFFVQVFKTPVCDITGNVIGIQGIFWDVTERETAAAALQQSEAVLSVFFRASPAAISIHTVQSGRLVEVNDRYCEFLGYQQDELIGRSILELGLWANPDDRVTVIQRLLQEGAIHDHETRYRLKSGEVRDVLVSMELIELAGESEPVLISMFTDITRLKQASQALADERKLLRTVIDNLPGQIFVKDTQGRYLVSNHSHWRALGAAAETELLGKTARDFLPGEIARADQTDDLALLETGQPVLDREETSDLGGKHYWHQLTKVPLRDEHGRIAGLVGIRHDITEKKQIEAQFLRSQRMESIGGLAGGIAHDLNNALTPILMASQFLKLTCTDPQTARVLDTIHESARRGAGMVKQILTFARGSEGENVHIQPKHLVGEMVEIARNTFSKAIQIRTQVSPDTWPLTGNPTRLHQILLNLCVNARDAMPDGGTLTLTAGNIQLDEAGVAISPEAKPGRYVVLTVADTGTGMPPEVRERIFEPFFTTKAPDRGTGLGLSTVNGIVKSHDGFLTVDSEVGRGTTFSVYLPVPDASVAPVAEAAPPPPADGKRGTHPGGGRRGRHPHPGHANPRGVWLPRRDRQRWRAVRRCLRATRANPATHGDGPGHAEHGRTGGHSRQSHAPAPAQDYHRKRRGHGVQSRRPEGTRGASPPPQTLQHGRPGPHRSRRVAWANQGGLSAGAPSSGERNWRLDKAQNPASVPAHYDRPALRQTRQVADHLLHRPQARRAYPAGHD